MRTIIPSKTRTSLYSATAINRTNGVEAAPTFSPHAKNHTTTTNYNINNVDNNNNNNNVNNNQEFDKLNGNGAGSGGGGGGGGGCVVSGAATSDNGNLPVSATTGAAIRITENPLPENVAC